MQLCPVSGGGLDMKRRATKALQDERLTGIRGGQARGSALPLDAGTVEHSLMVEPGGDTAPSPDVGTVKHGLMVEPGG
jgi:hypothetical protein